MIYIKHATLCTPFKILKNFGLLIKDGKIHKLISSAEYKAPASVRVIDAKGKIVCPGFIDVHIQGAGGRDALDAEENALRAISRTVAEFGTTSFLATTVFKNGNNRHIENIVKFRPSGGANCLGMHLEGPFINPKRKGMIRPDGIAPCSGKRLNKILEATKGKLRMMTIAPEQKGAIKIIETLKKKKIIASFGHSDATHEETAKGINAGITHATHIFNAMRPIHHREPGGLTACLLNEKVSVQLISDGVHIHPEVVRMILKLKGVKNIVLITDSMASQGLPDGKYVYDSWAYESKDGVCRYKDGTLIGTAVPLNQMIRRMIKFCGINLCEGIQMATINPADILGISDNKGMIEEGKDADLVIMDKDFNVFMTIVEGKIAHHENI